MHVVHTAGLPPNHGRMNFAISGWTRNSRKAPVKMVRPKASMMGGGGSSNAADARDCPRTWQGQWSSSTFQCRERRYRHYELDMGMSSYLACYSLLTPPNGVAITTPRCRGRRNLPSIRR